MPLSMAALSQPSQLHVVSQFQIYPGESQTVLIPLTWQKTYLMLLHAAHLLVREQQENPEILDICLFVLRFDLQEACSMQEQKQYKVLRSLKAGEKESEGMCKFCLVLLSPFP